MAARPHWDGLSVRRGSLDSNSKKLDKKRLGVIPFKCSVHPRHITQNMENKLSSSASNSCHQSPLRTAGMLPDHYKELEHLRKENFNLKLRIYLLEKEMVAHNSTEDDQGNMKFDMELENEIRDKMLDEAVRTSKINEAKFIKAEKHIKELMAAKEKLEAQLVELRSAFYKKDMDVQELRHVVQDKDNEIQSLKENKHKLKFVIQQLVVELNKNSTDKKGDKLLKTNLTVQSPKSKLDENKAASPSRSVESCSPVAKESISELESLQKENLLKQDTINQMNIAVETLTKTNEKLSSEIEEKNNLMKDLQVSLQKVTEEKDNLVKDLQVSLQEMTERFHNLEKDLCESNAKHLCLKCESKEPSLMLNESVQTVLTDNPCIANQEEVEAVISSLHERIAELHAHIQDLNYQKSTIFRQHNVLQEHLEKLACFMAELIDTRLSITGDNYATSQFLSAISRCIESTIELSHSFMQDVSSMNPCDFTQLDDPSFAPGSKFNFESTRHSVLLRPLSPKDENVNEVSTKDTFEGHSTYDAQLKTVELQQQLSDYKRHHQFAQEKVEALLREKQFLNQQLIESEGKNHNLNVLLEKLNYEKSLYEQENLQNKANFSSVESMCNNLQAQLQMTKEKLKELYKRCHQYEEEVTNLKKENKCLIEKNQSLQNIIQLQAGNDAKLPADCSDVSAPCKEDTTFPEKLPNRDASTMCTIDDLKDDYGKLSHYVSEDVKPETLKTLNESVLIDHPLKWAEEKSLEVESEAAKEDSQVFSLKNTISEQKQKFHKAIWKKDFLLVTKTVLNQRLTAEVDEKNEIIKKLQAEVDHKENALVTLKKQLNVLEEEKELLENEKIELFSRISTYTSETRDIQAQLLELKKQVQERELSQENTEREVEDLKYQLQDKTAEINYLKSGPSEVKVHKCKPERNKKILNQTVQTEQFIDSDDDLASLSGENQCLSSQLHKTKEMLRKREALCRNLHSQVQTLCHKIRDFKHSPVQHETSFVDQNDSQTTSVSKVEDTRQISEEESVSKPIASSEQEHEIRNVCQMSVKQEEFEEKLSTITKLENQISVLKSELYSMEQESKSIREQNVNLIQQMKEQNSVIHNLTQESKAMHAELLRHRDSKTSVSETEGQIFQLQQDLAEKELIIQNLSTDRHHTYNSPLVSTIHFEQELKKKDYLIDQLELKIKEKSELLYQFKNTLQEKAQLIDQQSHELEQNFNRMSMLQAEVVKSSELIEKLSNELEVKSCLIENLKKLKTNTQNHDCDARNNISISEVNKEHGEPSHDGIQLVDQGELRHVNKKLKQCSDSVTSQKQVSEAHSLIRCNEIATQTVFSMSNEESEAADVIDYITMVLEYKQREEALQHQVEEYHKKLKYFQLQYKDLQGENTSLREKLNNTNIFVQKAVEDGKIAKDKLSELEKQIKCMKEDEITLKSRISKMLDELSSKDMYITSLAEEKQNLQTLVNQYENHMKEIELTLKNATDDLTIMKSNLEEKSCLIEKLNDELTAKSNVISQFELNSKEKDYFISQLQNQLDDKIKCIDQQSSDLRGKSGCISELQEELAALHNLIKQLKSELDLKMVCIEKLNSDLKHQTEISVKLEQELKHKEDLIDKYKDNNKSKSKLIVGLKESIEGRNDTVKHLEKELDERTVTIGELRNQVNQKTLECEEIRKQLVASKDFVAEKKETIKHLEEKIAELQSLYSSKVPMSDITKPNCDKGVQHSGNHTPEKKEKHLLLGTKSEKSETSFNRKLSLQKSILQLQLKLFKNTALPLQQHFSFVDRIATLYSIIVPDCHPSNNSNIPTEVEEQQFFHTLEGDVEFLKNIRHFLKHIVLPSMKCETTVSAKSSACTKESLLLHEPEPWDKSDEEIANLLKSTKTIKNGFTSFDAAHTENICKQNDDTLTPVYMETSDNDSRIELEQGLTTAGYDQPAYEFLEPINSRSKYSSPDLGIESDPNQDPVIHKPVDRSDFPHMSKDSLSSQLYYDQEETWDGTSHICAVGVLKDFEFLRKEIEECIVGMKAISSRASEGLKTFGKSTSPKKMLECSTLKGILDSCKNVEMCLHQAENLINSFRFGPYPKHEDRAFDVVFKENQTLKQKIKELADELKHTKSVLKESEKKAEAKARSISKQLVETKRVLRKAKANFEQKLGGVVP